MRILVVDDTRLNLMMISEYVLEQGHEVIQAENGQQALEKYHAQKPDLILLDVIMPDILGFEVARQIRAAASPEQWTPIIFLSGMTTDQDLENGIRSGGDDYLFKPVSKVVLHAKIEAMHRILRMQNELLLTKQKLEEANQELTRLSSSDGLTGIANRRHFDDYLLREWRRARRGKHPISLIMFDIDHFKLFNDHYGHQAGDDCLRGMARAIKSCIERPTDLVARYGGEEFSVVMPDTPMGGAVMIAEKIRHHLHRANIPHIGSPKTRLTLSIGIASLNPDTEETPHQLIEQADKALYRAKREGRDRVCRFQEHLDQN